MGESATFTTLSGPLTSQLTIWPMRTLGVRYLPSIHARIVSARLVCYSVANEPVREPGHCYAITSLCIRLLASPGSPAVAARKLADRVSCRPLGQSRIV